jgi:hypothetical protein
MPKKPTREVIEAAKKTLDPREVMQAIVNDPACAELRAGLIDAGLVEEIKVKE